MKEKINATLENLVTEYYAYLGISNGDISPSQQIRWDNIVEETEDLIKDLIIQNLKTSRKPNNTIRYFEIGFDDEDEFSICIRGLREPSIEEAQKFVWAHGVDKSAKVIFVNEISALEAYMDYDMEEHSRVIFGK